MATSVSSRFSLPALLAFVIAATFVLPRAALAEEPEASTATERQWYGGPMVAADAVSFSLLLAADAVDDGDGSRLLGFGGVTGLVLFGPIDHYTRGHGKRAALSVAMRVGLPLMGVLVAAVACTPNGGGGDNCDDSVRTGALFGVFTAMVLDDVLLAVDERPVARSSSGLQLGLAPRGEGGFTASVGATF